MQYFYVNEKCMTAMKLANIRTAQRFLNRAGYLAWIDNAMQHAPNCKFEMKALYLCKNQLLSLSVSSLLYGMFVWNHKQKI